jgi:bifunctional NMN adenylyltransferase/nudix hydrolase
MKDFDVLVCLGRFQPFHLGHKSIIEAALERADRVIVIVGSAHRARSVRNPFTAEERANMIYNTFPGESRLVVTQVSDQMYNNNAWVLSVQHAVRPYEDMANSKKARVGLIGHDKDATSYYLRMFPQWEFVEMPMVEDFHGTDIRNALFVHNDLQEYKLPKEVAAFLRNFKSTPSYDILREEFRIIKQYRDSWSSAPYAPIFVTVDALVIQGGHILLVERGASPGKGLWALPGGFVDQQERLVDAVLRELREETRLKVPEPVLRGSIQRSQVFDHPDRSDRGRTITHAYLIQLEGSNSLPQVKGGDDARKARWIPLSELNSREMFEDHMELIKTMLGSDFNLPR